MQILNSLFTGNRHGIYLKETEKATVKGNQASRNSEMGLLAEGAKETTVESNSFSNNTLDGAQLLNCRDDANKTRLTSNSARENEGNGIHVKGSTGVTIENNVSLSDNVQHGVLVENSDGVAVVKNAVIRGNGQAGVAVQDSTLATGRPPITIAGNVIEGSSGAAATVAGGGQPYGIYLKNAAGVRIGAAADRNTLRYNAQAGIALEACMGGATEAQKNVVEGNNLEYNAAGVLLKASCGNIVRGANAIGPGNGDGVKLDGCQCPAALPNEITGNESIHENKMDGVALLSSWGNRVANNKKIEKNGRHGVSIAASQSAEGAPNVISDNSILKSGANGIDVQASRLHALNGNRIAGSAAMGVNLIEAALITVKGNTILGKEGDSPRQRVGIYLARSVSNNFLEDNTISDNSETGIHVQTSERPTVITGNTITAGATEPKQQIGVLAHNSCNVIVGAELTAAAAPAATANTIADHSKAGIHVERGRCIESFDENTIAGNTVRNNVIGILAQNVIHLRIGGAGAGNTVTNNTTAGIQLEEAQSATVQENTVGPGNGDGIRLERCTPPADAANRVLKNGVGQNTGHGIVLVNSYGNIIGGAAGNENSIVRNSKDGLRLESCEPPAGRANRVSYNIVGPGNKDGVVLDGTTGHELTQLAVQGNTAEGVSLKLSPRNKIFDNPSISGNTGNGIRVESSDEVQIYATEVRDNTGSGILLDQSHKVVIGLKEQPVKVIANKQHGLQVDHCSDVTITGGEYDRNVKDGIRFNWSSGNQILGAPLVRSNGEDGIGLDHASNNVLTPDAPAFVQARYRMKPVYAGQVLTNTEAGIHLRNGSSGNRIENFLVQRHKNGVFIEGSNNNTIRWNQIVTAAVCIRERHSTGNDYIVNTFLLCGLPTSPSAQVSANGTAAVAALRGSLALENASADVIGNVFEQDAGDAVTLRDRFGARAAQEQLPGDRRLRPGERNAGGDGGCAQQLVGRGEWAGRDRPRRRRADQRHGPVPAVAADHGQRGGGCCARHRVCPEGRGLGPSGDGLRLGLAGR